MDFKGVAWAGDIYEKFEAMCLEVEEIMYEDTVKYVENQAQKVGVSVKKLYEEVMQDLLLPSRLGPVPPLETDINEKPNPTISEINNKQAVVEENICNLTPQDSTPNVRDDDAKRLSPTPHRVLAETAQSDECCGESRRSGPTRRPIGIKRISHPPEAPRPASSLYETRSNYFVVNDDLNVTASSELFARHDPSEAVAKCRASSDASPEPCSSNQILSAESVKQDDGATPAPIDMFREDGSLSHINSNITETCHVGSSGEEATASYEDNFDIEVIEPTEKSRLEESCVLVEGDDDELHFISRGSKKHKSYKKKIYNVLSLKLRSTKKKDLCISEHVDGLQTFEIQHASPIITFLLKRFGPHGKKPEHVAFPPSLDLSPFACTSDAPLNYHLYGVIVHDGSTMESGHYYCYIRTNTKTWYLYNDSEVSPVDQATVTEQSAYMLFYAKEGSSWFETAAGFKQMSQRTRALQDEFDDIISRQQLLRNMLDDQQGTWNAGIGEGIAKRVSKAAGEVESLKADGMQMVKIDVPLQPKKQGTDVPLQPKKQGTWNGKQGTDVPLQPEKQGTWNGGRAKGIAKRASKAAGEVQSLKVKNKVGKLKGKSVGRSWGY